jgi:multisubunit Na+/H+ antiporter MnhG subunit
VTRRAGLLRAAPWVLSGTALALLVLAAVVHLATREDIGATTTDTVLFLVGCVTNAGTPIVGLLLARRLPLNPMGWLLLAIGLCIGLFAALPALRQADVLPYWIGAWLEFTVYLLLLPLACLLLLLFPDGHFAGPRWRWAARATALLALVVMVMAPFVSWADDPAAASPWAVPATPDNPATSTPWAVHGVAGEQLLLVFNLGTLVLFLLTDASVGSIFVRFRRASPVERQQLKWFLFAGALLVAAILPDLVDLRIGNSVWPSVAVAVFGLLPMAVGIAVLRFRLYEIDRIISRSVSYGLLTGLLVALYLTLVALLRPLLEPLTGGSSLAVAGSTLAVAAGFSPARRRLQGAVDRRFDRARYDADRAVQAFAARLRTQVDLDEVTEGLRDTVAATVAPTQVAVWLRVPSGTGGM